MKPRVSGGSTPSLGTKLEAKAMRMLEWLIRLRDEAQCVPSSKEGRKLGPPSNGELRRWCRSGAIVINRKRMEPGDEIRFPVKQLLFFPRSPQSRTTIMQTYRRPFKSDWVGGPSNKQVLRGVAELLASREEQLRLKSIARGNVETSSSGG